MLPRSRVNFVRFVGDVFAKVQATQLLTKGRAPGVQVQLGARAQELAQEAGVPAALPWFVLPLAGPFGLFVAATMTWLNLQAM